MDIYLELNLEISHISNDNKDSQCYLSKLLISENIIKSYSNCLISQIYLTNGESNRLILNPKIYSQEKKTNYQSKKQQKH